MDAPTEPMVAEQEASNGYVAIVYCNEPFAFADGHQMRGTPCLICRDGIGGEPATVIGVAALDGPSTSCGHVVSDVFLAHAGHFPMPPEQLQAAIHRGLHVCAS